MSQQLPSTWPRRVRARRLLHSRQSAPCSASNPYRRNGSSKPLESYPHPSPTISQPTHATPAALSQNVPHQPNVHARHRHRLFRHLVTCQAKQNQPAHRRQRRRRQPPVQTRTGARTTPSNSNNGNKRKVRRGHSCTQSAPVDGGMGAVVSAAVSPPPSCHPPHIIHSLPPFLARLPAPPPLLAAKPERTSAPATPPLPPPRWPSFPACH